MAEEAKKPEPGKDEAGKKKSPLMTIILLAGVMVVEGIAISAVFLLSGGPSPAQADGAVEDAAAEMDKPAEVLVLADKFQNTRRGRAYLYDTEIFVIVATKHKDEVTAAIEAKKAAITADIGTIIRKAEPAHLMEQELATLRRQVQAALEKRLGMYEPDGTPFVQEVLVTRCDEYRSDG